MNRPLCVSSYIKSFEGDSKNRCNIMIRTEDDIIKAIERGERMIKTAHAFGKNQSEVFGHVRY